VLDGVTPFPAEFGPLDRIIVQLPDTARFGYLYFALQRIGSWACKWGL